MSAPSAMHARERSARRPVTLAIVASLTLLCGCHRANAVEARATVASPGTEPATTAAAVSSAVSSADAEAPVDDGSDLHLRARTALGALRTKNMEVLARLCHPTRGVRFSPYANVLPAFDVVLSPAQLRVAMKDRTPRDWGSYDGSGDPIRLPFADYFARFVYDVDFASRAEVSFDKTKSLASGNSIDNVATAYPSETVMELYAAGTDPKFSGMDWRDLRLVFAREGKTWWLVGVVHDQWTI